MVKDMQIDVIAYLADGFVSLYEANSFGRNRGCDF